MNTGQHNERVAWRTLAHHRGKLGWGRIARGIEAHRESWRKLPACDRALATDCRLPPVSIIRSATISPAIRRPRATIDPCWQTVPFVLCRLFSSVSERLSQRLGNRFLTAKTHALGKLLFAQRLLGDEVRISIKLYVIRQALDHFQVDVRDGQHKPSGSCCRAMDCRTFCPMAP